jgi:hypothetical protein
LHELDFQVTIDGKVHGLESALINEAEIEVISEAKIKEAAAGRIGASLGIPRP